MADVTFVALEGQHQGVAVRVQATANEVSVDRLATWKPQKNRPADFIFSGSAPMTMKLGLLFDGVQSATPVQPDVDKLQQFTAVDALLKRPPKVQVSFGSGRLDALIPPIKGVIESCSIRYQAFDPQGLPLLAAITITCTEADHVSSALPVP